MSNGDRYVLGVNGHPSTLTEVTREEFVRAERGAGFHPKGEDRGQTATGGFSNGSVKGSVIPPGYDFDEYLEWLRSDLKGDGPQFDLERNQRARGAA